MRGIAVLRVSRTLLKTYMGTICLQCRDPHFRLCGYALQQSGIDAIIIALSYQILLVLLLLLTTTSTSPVDLREPL